MIAGRIYAKDSSVRLWEARPELLFGIATVAPLFGARGLPVVVTSLNDSQHRRFSLHYSGEAVDLRSKHVPREQLEDLVDEIRAALPEGTWDVLLEHQGESNEHFHIEYDPDF